MPTAIAVNSQNLMPSMDVELLERACEDIREWFGDAGLSRSLDNLAPPYADALWIAMS